MKLINDKGKLFGIVNPIDIVAVLCVIAVGVVLAWFLIGGGTASGSDRYIFYTVEVRASSTELSRLHNAQQGDQLLDNIFGVPIGEVYAVSYVTRREWMADDVNKRMVESEMPGYYTLRVTIKSRGLFNGRTHEIMNPGYEIRVGQEVHFRGPGYQAYGFVVELRGVID